MKKKPRFKPRKETALKAADNTKPLAVFSERFHQWLDQDPVNRREELIQAGIPAGHVQALIAGTTPEKILNAFWDRIERITGLNVGESLYARAKQIAWGGPDYLPDLTTQANLVAVISKIKKSQGSKFTADLFGVSERAVYNWLKSDGRRLGCSQSVNLLRGVLSFRSGEFPKTSPLPTRLAVAEKRDAIVEEHADTKPLDSVASRKMASLFISMLTSVAGLLQAPRVPPETFSPGDQAHVIGSVRKILTLCGIDGATIRKLIEQDMLGPTTEDTRLVLRLLAGGQQPRPAKKR